MTKEALIKKAQHEKDLAKFKDPSKIGPLVKFKDHPILMSTPMVIACQEDRKTMTRRILKEQPVIDGDSGYVYWGGHQFDIHTWKDDILEFCPYGIIEDVLWVRESFMIQEGTINHFLYKANCPDSLINSYKWKPSIHMPKSACRLFLKIKDIRIEPLTDISQEDAKAEGVFTAPHRPSTCGRKRHADGSIARDCFICSFRHLWNIINGERGYDWIKDPWVWVIEFEKVKA